MVAFIAIFEGESAEAKVCSNVAHCLDQSSGNTVIIRHVECELELAVH